MGAVHLFLAVALAAAFASVVLGRNLTRSLFAAALALTAVALSLVAAGAGFAALLALIVAGLTLAIVQVFGWMLVDVDRDHLLPTDRPTWIARALAFGLLGGAIALLLAALPEAVDVSSGAEPKGAAIAALAARFFGPWRDLATLCGLAIAAGLLAVLMLLRGDRGDAAR